MSRPQWLTALFLPALLPRTRIWELVYLINAPNPWGYGADRHQKIVDFLVRATVSSVVDLGCHEGAFLRHLAARKGCGRLVGVDVSRRVLGRIDAACERRQYDLGRLFEPDFDPVELGGPYDAVVVIDVLYYLAPGFYPPCWYWYGAGPDFDLGRKHVLVENLKRLAARMVITNNHQKNRAIVALLERTGFERMDASSYYRYQSTPLRRVHKVS